MALTPPRVAGAVASAAWCRGQAGARRRASHRRTRTLQRNDALDAVGRPRVVSASDPATRQLQPQPVVQRPLAAWAVHTRASAAAVCAGRRPRQLYTPAVRRQRKRNSRRVDWHTTHVEGRKHQGLQGTRHARREVVHNAVRCAARRARGGPEAVQPLAALLRHGEQRNTGGSRVLPLNYERLPSVGHLDQVFIAAHAPPVSVQWRCKPARFSNRPSHPPFTQCVFLSLP
jgi:hypothetical protein